MQSIVAPVPGATTQLFLLQGGNRHTMQKTEMGKADWSPTGGLFRTGTDIALLFGSGGWENIISDSLGVSIPLQIR